MVLAAEQAEPCSHLSRYHVPGVDEREGGMGGRRVEMRLTYCSDASRACEVHRVVGDANMPSLVSRLLVGFRLGEGGGGGGGGGGLGGWSLTEPKSIK